MLNPSLSVWSPRIDDLGSRAIRRTPCDFGFGHTLGHCLDGQDLSGQCLGFFYTCDFGFGHTLGHCLDGQDLSGQCLGLFYTYKHSCCKKLALES
ncbi:unnamed protein product [Cochlearia groenlandica]